MNSLQYASVRTSAVMSRFHQSGALLARSFPRSSIGGSAPNRSRARTCSSPSTSCSARPRGSDGGADRRRLHPTRLLVGEPDLLQRLTLEVLTSLTLGLGVVLSWLGDQVGGAALEPLEGDAGEDLLLGRGALGAA